MEQSKLHDCYVNISVKVETVLLTEVYVPFVKDCLWNAAVYLSTVRSSPYLAANNPGYYVTENNDRLCTYNTWSGYSCLIGVDIRSRTSESVSIVKILFFSTNLRRPINKNIK